MPLNPTSLKKYSETNAPATIAALQSELIATRRRLAEVERYWRYEYNLLRAQNEDAENRAEQGAAALNAVMNGRALRVVRKAAAIIHWHNVRPHAVRLVRRFKER